MIVSNGEFIAKFETALLFDNCEPVTLKLKPLEDGWTDSYIKLFESDFKRYCTARKVDYVLYPEKGQSGNHHYHGIIIYPFDKVRRNFVAWFCKYYGKYFVSEKGDSVGWHNYCAKQVKPNQQDLMDTPYLFDPQYECH